MQTMGAITNSPCDEGVMQAAPAAVGVPRRARGVGRALLTPGSLAIISAYFAPAQRGKAIGTWSGFTTLTSALGPVLGGWLIQAASWRWIFFLNVPLAAMTLAIVALHVPESRDEQEQGPLDWREAVLARAGLGAIVYALISAGTAGLGSPLVLVTLVGGVGALVAFVQVERVVPSPLLPLGLFRSRTFTGTNLLTLLLYVALGGALFFLPFNLQQVQ